MLKKFAVFLRSYLTAGKKIQSPSQSTIIVFLAGRQRYAFLSIRVVFRLGGILLTYPRSSALRGRRKQIFKLVSFFLSKLNCISFFYQKFEFMIFLLRL